MQTEASHGLGAFGKIEREEANRGQLAPRTAGDAAVGLAHISEWTVVFSVGEVLTSR
jgi:hypothetical protein